MQCRSYVNLNNYFAAWVSICSEPLSCFVTRVSVFFTGENRSSQNDETRSNGMVAVMAIQRCEYRL